LTTRQNGRVQPHRPGANSRQVSCRGGSNDHWATFQETHDAARLPIAQYGT
jgi:hypothetical protein